MDRTNVTTTKQAEEIKRDVKAPGEKNRHTADFDAATQPASGAAVQQAAVEAGQSAERQVLGSTDALKRAAENDTRP